jgi:1-acyl-sn-glycerol-3-phosphate acyltransferase
VTAPAQSTAHDLAWAVGRPIVGGAGALVSRLHVYGRKRVPKTGGVVLAFNHFHWIDIPCVGFACPRSVYFVAKVEAHRVPGLGQFIRLFGTMPVRRGESDRDAVRRMREVVAGGSALGVFVEGTRQRSGVPGHVQPGAAMAALQGNAPVVCAAIHGSESWKPGRPVSIVWGEPLNFDGLPRGGKGYREASLEIERELRRLWEWLCDLHEAGRPRGVPLP